MAKPIPVIAPAGPGDLAAIREMLAEYAAWVGFDLALHVTRPVGLIRRRRA